MNHRTLLLVFAIFIIVVVFGPLEAGANFVPKSERYGSPGFELPRSIGLRFGNFGKGKRSFAIETGEADLLDLDDVDNLDY